MTETCDLCCDRCGGTAFSHFFGLDRRGRRCWQNRCDGCGRASEYVPTRSEIESQCRELRGPLAPLALDDEQEKLWRREASLADVRPDFDDEDWGMRSSEC